MTYVEDEDRLLADMKSVSEAPPGRVRDLASAQIFERLAKKYDDGAAALIRVAADQRRHAADLRRVAQMYRDGAIADALLSDATPATRAEKGEVSL